MMIHHLDFLEPVGEKPFALDEVNDRLKTADVSSILRWAKDAFGDKLVIATGFGPSGVVLIHYAAESGIDLGIFYLDTGLLFPSTYRLRDELSQRFGLTIEPVSGISLDEQSATHGDRLWARNPDHCCHIRKVIPLQNHLSGKDAWITGLRRDQSSGRARTQIVEWDVANGLYKLNPLAEWTSDRVWAHIRSHDLPYNTLHDEGYPSIGCEPCTTSVRAGEEERSGRWAGSRKTECGIHRRREVA